MAYSNIPLLTGGSLFQDTANANAAIAVKASSGVLYAAELDNTAVAAASYFKLYNAAAGGVTVGTTVPDWVIMVPASTKITLVLPSGITFGTAISAATVTAGGTSGTTSPTGNFAVKLVYV